MRKYDGNRNTTLIITRAQCLALCLRPPRYLFSFRGVQARLFSGVTSVFIVDAQSNPQPDFQDMARHRYELRSLPLPSRGGFQPGQLLSPPNSTAQTLLWPTSTLSLLQFDRLPSRRIHYNIGQTMVQPLRPGRNARIRYRSQPSPTAEDERDGHLGFRSRCRMPATYASRCSPPPQLRPLQLPLLHQQSRRRSPHRTHPIGFLVYLIISAAAHSNPPPPLSSILCY